MEYLVKRSAITSEKTACAIVAIFAGKRLSAEAQQLDRLYDGIISSATKSGDFSAGWVKPCCCARPKALTINACCWPAVAGPVNWIF